MKTNSPLSIPKETSCEGGDVGLVDLRHVLERDHRRARRRRRGAARRLVLENGRRGVCVLEIRFLHGR